ncbi:hypothetical protein BH09BAC5_BH09BAC5_14110 [soil metagenome]
MKTIDLKNTIVSLDDEGIIHIHIKAHSNMQLNDAVDTLEAMRVIGENKKFPVLIDAGEFSNVDKEVRIFSADAENNIYTLADAIAYSTFAQKLVANFYVKHNQPSVPTKIFGDKEEAIVWLRTFLKK